LANRHKTPEDLLKEQEEMKTRQQAAPPEEVSWKIPKGVYLRGNLKKQKKDDIVLAELFSIAEEVCPDEMLTGPLASLRGKGLKMYQVLLRRFWYGALCGNTKSDEAILNRLLGRVPYAFDKSGDKDNGLSNMSPEQILKESKRMLKGIRDLLTVRKKPKDVVSEPDPDSVPEPIVVTEVTDMIVSEPEPEDAASQEKE
jgi:hypothetical protein